MKTLESILKEEICRLKDLVKEIKYQKKDAPEGHIRIAKKGRGMQYYYKSADDRSINGRYLKKNEIDIARRIAQRDYDTDIVKHAEARIKAIDLFLKNYEKTSLQRIYENTNPYRRELITTSIILDEEYIKRWQSVKYEGKSFADNIQEIITERGERVRSKSEKIIADKLYTLGIPYRYEYPITLEGNIKIYPDFTILKMPQREEVYLEHFGLMDNSEYMDSVIYKLNTYERNGIYLGVNLFMTHETSNVPLNTRALDGMIKQLFCVEE